MTSTIGQIPPLAARRFGAGTALLVGDRSLSFNDLEALSNRVANGLVAAGVQPGDRVALYGPNCWEWLVAYYGVAKTGAVLIPVNVMLTPDEVRYVVEDSGTKAVVASAPTWALKPCTAPRPLRLTQRPSPSVSLAEAMIVASRGCPS